jgi:uncharacterized protein (TIGR02284 family)
MQTETKTIERLIELTQDSVNGYREAAELVEEESPTLAGLFESRARKREQILSQLRARLRATDADSDALRSDGTTAGHLHQYFMRFRSAFQEDRKAALAEVDRGESLLVKTYEEAAEDADPQLRALAGEFLDSIRKDERTVEVMHENA